MKNYLKYLKKHPLKVVLLLFVLIISSLIGVTLIVNPLEEVWGYIPVGIICCAGLFAIFYHTYLAYKSDGNSK